MQNEKRIRQIVHASYEEAITKMSVKRSIDVDNLSSKDLVELYGRTLYRIVQTLESIKFTFSCSKNEEKLLEWLKTVLSTNRGKITSTELKNIIDFINKTLKVIEQEDRQVSIKSRLFGMNCFMVSYLFKYVTQDLFIPIVDILEKRNKEMKRQDYEEMILSLENELKASKVKMQRIQQYEKDSTTKDEQQIRLTQELLNQQSINTAAHS